MKIVVVAMGTRGDVVPYSGLAASLRAAGHHMAIATHTPFEEMVRGWGFDFHPLPMDLRAELASEEGGRALGTSPRALASNIGMYARHAETTARAIEVAACGADMVLLSAMAWLGLHVAEGMGVRSAGVYLQPLDPTAEFPPWPVTNRSLGRFGNRAAAQAVRTLGQWPFRKVVAELRRRLGLPPTTPGAYFRRLDRERWPVYYGFSPAVLPAPADWPPYRRVVGYWWPETDPHWKPPPALTDFLAAGPPPVFVGFGSMPAADPDQLTDLVVTALRRAGVRGVVQHGWAGLAAAGDDVLAIGDIPHSWLFPRMAALVHHAGAGTTAAGVRAGVPTVPVPVAADQPMWAGRLVRLGVSPAVLPQRHLAAAALADVIKAAAGGDFRSRAADLAGRVAAEDGAGAVAAAITDG